MRWIPFARKSRVIIASFFSICWGIQCSAMADSKEPTIEVNRENTKSLVILRWPRATKTEYRLEGRNLFFAFNQSMQNDGIADIATLLPSVVEAVDYGYDSLLLQLNKGVLARVVPLSDGVRIALSQPTSAATDEAGRLEYLRALALYNDGEVMESRKQLRDLTAREPHNVDALALLAQIEEQLGRGVVAMSVLRGLPATGTAMAPWIEQETQYLTQAYGNTLQIDGQWREVENAETEVITPLSGRYNIAKYKLSLAFSAENRWVEIGAVQRSDGSISSFDGTRQRGDLELRKDWASAQGTVFSLSAASAGVGIGGGVRHEVGSDFGVTGLSVFFNEPYYEFVESVIDGGSRDQVIIDHSARIGKRLTGDVGVSFARYGIANDDDVARAVGAVVNLEYALYEEKPYIGLNYALLGRYVTEIEERVDGAGETFNPLPLDSVEIHSLGLNVYRQLLGKLNYSLSGGYAIDRKKEGSGPFGTLSLAYRPSSPVQAGLRSSIYPRLDRGTDSFQLTLGGFLAVSF
jgi:hypothetical protein